TALAEATYAPGADTTQQADAKRRYPGVQQADPSAPYYGDYYGSAPPPAAPGRKGPPAGLIAALAVLAVALIGGLVYFLVRDDGDGSGGNGHGIRDRNSTATEPDK